MLTANRARKTARNWYSRSRFTPRSARREENLAEDVLLGMAAGAIGGIVGALAMEQAHKLFDYGKDYVEDQLGYSEEPTLFDDAAAGPRREEDDEEPATAKAASAVARAAGYRLDDEDKKVGGQMMHYGFAVSMGAFYGGLAAIAKPVTYGHGVPAGALLWAVADEAVVPALGLAKGPLKHPPAKHAQALWNHLVFGFVVETIRSLAVRLFGSKA